MSHKTIENGQTSQRSCTDVCFVANCFCYDGCVWAPLNPRPSDTSKHRRSKPFCQQLKNNAFFYLTIITVGVLNGLFFYFDAPYLWQEIHPAVPLITVVLLLITLLALFATACTDPGILPPSTDDETTNLETTFKIAHWEPGQMYPPTRATEVQVYNQPYKLKYCYTCRFFRPPRSSHCSQCNCCVDQFDHHCPWIGNCVGRRNYRCFILFLISLASMGVYVTACVATHLILLTRNFSFGEAIKKSPASLIELILLFLAIWSILGLTGYHCYLVMSNLTTNEDIKGTFVSRQYGRGEYLENPFTHGSAYNNCGMVLCGSRPTTRLHH